MSNYKFNFEYLPKDVVSRLKILFRPYREYRSQNNLLLIVSLVFHKQTTEGSLSLQYVPLSVAYWRKVIGSHYSTYVNVLIAQGILQTEYVLFVSDFGDDSRVMGYRINPELLKDEFSLIRYSGAKKESDSADVVNNRFDGNIPITKLGFQPDRISMQKIKALDWVKSSISEVVDGYKNKEYISGIPQTLPVLVRILKDDSSFAASHMSVEAALKIASDQGKELIYYKDKFVIANEDFFNQVALQNLTAHYNWQIKSFLPEKFNFSRNSNTLRVYSKLSSLPSALLPFIRINGQYILQADLKCSQFTIFGNMVNYYLNHSGTELIKLFKKKQAISLVSGLVTILDKHKDELPEEGLNPANPQEDIYNSNDIYKFLVDSLLHDFYGIIRSELNLPQRQHGKGIAFRTVFAKSKPENELVKQFRYLYPSVISIINDFKEKFGYNQFAIMLQRVEAEIFIDHIWKKAKQLEINSFTRHDSLVFPINKKKEVKQIITNVFRDFDFIYNIEFEEINAEEIEQRMVNETDYIDSTDDFDELLFYTMEQNKKEKMEQDEINNIREQLQDVKLPEFKERDYYDKVNLDTLWSLIELDGLSLESKLALETDIANLQSNYPVPHFQAGTNNLISKLIDMVND